MVRPGWGSHEDARLGVGGGDQLEPKAKRATTAGRLHAGDALVARVLAEQDRTKELGEALVASTSEIRFALLRLERRCSASLITLRIGVAGAVTENADSDIDLFGPRVRVGSAISARKKSVLTAEGRRAPLPSFGLGQHGIAIS